MTGPVSHFCSLPGVFLVELFYQERRRASGQSRDPAVDQLQGRETRGSRRMGAPLRFQKPTENAPAFLWTLNCNCSNRSSSSRSGRECSRSSSSSRTMNRLRSRHAEPLGLSRQTPCRPRNMAGRRYGAHVRDDTKPVGGFRGALRTPGPPLNTVWTNVTIRRTRRLALECAIDREGPATIRLSLTRATANASCHVNRVRMIAIPCRCTHFVVVV